MKKLIVMMVRLILMTGMAALPVEAINIAPMTWTAGRSDWINVKTDSAMTIHAVGNGVADDTAALQQAFNLASTAYSTRTTVYLPAGTYKITSTLYWSNNFSSIQHWGGTQGLWLVGCGSNTTIQWAGAAGGTMLLDQGSSHARYEGIVWNAGPGGAAAGFGVAHVGLAYYQTRMRHENEAFIGFTGVSGMGTISPPYAYTLTQGAISSTTLVPAGVTTLPLVSIPAGLIVGAGIVGTGIPTGAGGITTTTITAINTSTKTITLSVATNHATANGTVYNFCSSVAGTPETLPAAGIVAGTARETIPMAETMVWNCLFKNDTEGVIVGWEIYNNYMWIFQNDEFENCGTGIDVRDGKAVIMDTHFAASTTADVSYGYTRMRRCTSTGSKVFYQGGDTGAQSDNVFEDCWADGWTSTYGAMFLADRADMVFDCKFTHPPVGVHAAIYISPPSPINLLLSNNYSSPPAVPLTFYSPGMANVVNIPAGGLIPNVTSPNQTFLQSTWDADGPTILDVTQPPYNAVRGADCTTAIQAAITQAKTNNNGTVVYIPAGSYLTSATLNVSGGNYTIEGCGWASQLRWNGSASTTIPMFTVTTPQNIAINQLQMVIGNTLNVSTQPGISETSTGASSATYDGNSIGGYTNSPGVLLTSLPANSVVYMPICDSWLTVKDCGPATILSNYLCAGATVSGATHAKTGFLGALAMEGGQTVSTSGWDVTIDDNQDFIGCDYYNEQSYNHLLAENTHSASWTGRISFQGMKEESDAPSTTIGIQNFGGRIFYGSQGFANNYSPAVFTQTGSAPVDLILTGESYYDNPIFTLSSACNLIEANNIVSNPSLVYLADILPTGWGASAAAGLDHFRQADGYDLSLGYGWAQNVSDTSFEADAANPNPTTAIGYNPASWTVSNSLAAGGGARNCTVVAAASPFGAGTQGLLWVDSTGSATGSAITVNQNMTALPGSEPAVWSFDFRINSSANHSDLWVAALAGGHAAGNIHLEYNGTSTYLGSSIGGHDAYVATPLTNTWYRARFVVAPTSGGPANATLYLTPWTSTGPGTTTSYTVDGLAVASSTGISRIYLNSGSGPGANQSINLDNFTATNNTVFALP